MKIPSLEPTPERVIPPPIKNPVVDRSEPTAPQRVAVAPPPQRKSTVGRIVRWLVMIALCGAAWYFSPHWWPWVQTHLMNTQRAPVKPAPRPVPVLTAPVVQQRMNVYLNGLGTVTAFNTVTVKSRVEGELIKVDFVEGQMVEQGDLLAEIDPRPFQMQRDQAKGKIIQDEAALKLAQVTLDRQNELMRQNATTPQLVDQQVAIVNQADALLQIDKAIYENTLLQLQYCRITAPISGRIGLRLVDRGNIVRANDPNGLMVITQLEPIALVFTIPQDEIPRVQQRMREVAKLTVEAYDRDFKTRLATGELAAIDNQVDATTGTLRLKAMFDNKDHVLFPNQFVNARLLVDVIENALVVPTSAVQRGPEEMFVYVVKPDETVDLRTVVVGPSEGNFVSIQSGIQAGELVVTDGLDKLLPGSRVSFRKPDVKGKPGPDGAKKPAESGKPGSASPGNSSPRDTSPEPSKKTA